MTHMTIDLETAKKAVLAYNHGTYGARKNLDLDEEGRRLFSGGLGRAVADIERQVRFVGVDYGGAAGFKAAYSLVPAIAQDLCASQPKYGKTVRDARPILETPAVVALVHEVFLPFVKPLHQKRNWLVWASKFWHFLNPEAFPVLDSRVSRFLGVSGDRNSPEKYVLMTEKFREFALAHRDWVPELRSVDVGLSWSETKLWDKVMFGVGEQAVC